MIVSLPVNEYPRGTVEYVYSSLVDRFGVDLSGDTVEMAIHHGPVLTWLPATWTGANTVRTSGTVDFNATDYPESNYNVSVRVTDSPEAPIIRVGVVTLID